MQRQIGQSTKACTRACIESVLKGGGGGGVDSSTYRYARQLDNRSPHHEPFVICRISYCSAPARIVALPYPRTLHGITLEKVAFPLHQSPSKLAPPIAQPPAFARGAARASAAPSLCQIHLLPKILSPTLHNRLFRFLISNLILSIDEALIHPLQRRTHCHTLLPLPLTNPIHNSIRINTHSKMLNKMTLVSCVKTPSNYNNIITDNS